MRSLLIYMVHFYNIYKQKKRNTFNSHIFGIKLTLKYKIHALTSCHNKVLTKLHELFNNMYDL